MIVVVGGHSRKIGKTSVIAAIIRATPEVAWTAVKLTPHRHVSADLERACLLEQREPAAGDSGRFLTAGAVRSFLAILEPSGGVAVPADFAAMLSEAEDVLIESNSLLGVFEPDLYVFVVDPAVADWKASARAHIQRADAVVVAGGGGVPVPEELLPRAPRFEVRAPGYYCASLIDFIRKRRAALRRGEAMTGG